MNQELPKEKCSRITHAFSGADVEGVSSTLILFRRYFQTCPNKISKINEIYVKTWKQCSAIEHFGLKNNIFEKRVTLCTGTC